ncbi:MAG: hypothetical protein MZU79_07590 [Anaerotruncus sp.]|nr:hypothetical protein [Anaerotruncus sp.]
MASHDPQFEDRLNQEYDLQGRTRMAAFLSLGPLRRFHRPRRRLRAAVLPALPLPPPGRSWPRSGVILLLLSRIKTSHGRHEPGPRPGPRRRGRHRHHDLHPGRLPDQLLPGPEHHRHGHDRAHPPGLPLHDLPLRLGLAHVRRPQHHPVPRRPRPRPCEMLKAMGGTEIAGLALRRQQPDLPHVDHRRRRHRLVLSWRASAAASSAAASSSRRPRPSSRSPTRSSRASTSSRPSSSPTSTTSCGRR